MTTSAHRDPVLYTHAIAVPQAAIDELGHVNNSVYLRWVQEAITGFWRSIAPADLVAAQVWIAHRHEIVYRSPAFLDDQLTATVRVLRYSGVRAVFETRMTREDQAIAEVLSTLVCTDRETHALIRIRDDVARLFGVDNRLR